MTHRCYVRLAAAASTCVIAASLAAQSSREETVDTTAQPVIEVATPVQAKGGGEAQRIQYAAALDGTGLISMDGIWKSHMLIGATVGGGWDSNPDNSLSGTPSAVYTVSPYIGIKANTASTQFLLQYQPTITKYLSGNYSGPTMQAGSAKIIGSVSERWSWDINAATSHGQDSVRLLAPQQVVAVGEVPGTGPSSASYLPTAGIATYVDGGVGVYYRKSQRDSFELRVANSFSRFVDSGESNSIATTSFGFNRDMSPTLGLIVYEQGTHYYGSIDCTSFGGAVGIKWEVRDHTFFSLSGGPQVNTAACGSQQGFSYSSAFSTRLSGKSQLYLLAARQPTTSYLGPGLWQTSMSGGYQRQTVATGSVSFDLGYVRSDTLTSGSSYSGTYFDGILNHRLGHGLSASLSYRGFIGHLSGAASTRNVTLFSLAWTPLAWTAIAGRVFQ